MSPEDYVEYQVGHYLILIISPLLLVCGLIGNVLSFCIFYPKAVKSRTQSSYTFLAVLAVFDSLALLLSSLRGFLAHAFQLDIVLACHCGVYLFFSFIATDMSVYVIIAMTVDRSISVFLPFKAKTLCTRNRALVSMSVIFVILIAVNCSISFTYHRTEQTITVSNMTTSVYTCGALMRYSEWLNFVWPWIDMTVLSFLPCVVLTTLNCAILLRMRSQNKRVHVMGQPSDGRLASQKRTNILLLSICLVFFITTTPLTVLHIVEPYWSLDTPHQQAIHTMVSDIASQLLFWNNCLNFILYCLSGREFRNDLKRIFCRASENSVSSDVTAMN
ncbi:G-protein coupled receptor daf-37-like [Liolophura sinensis]|uniref:G-protein coupled receptor daf-37-like n=1 Tax=Liolophura sinensis TaxID=3198878 RepID=UPI00315880F0